MKLDSNPSSYKNLSWKWIKDINLNPQMLTLLDESIGITLCDTGAGRNSLRRTCVAQGFAPSANRQDDLKVKVSTQQRKPSAEQTDSPRNGRKSSPTTLQTKSRYLEFTYN